MNTKRPSTSIDQVPQEALFLSTDSIIEQTAFSATSESSLLNSNIQSNLEEDSSRLSIGNITTIPDAKTAPAVEQIIGLTACLKHIVQNKSVVSSVEPKGVEISDYRLQSKTDPEQLLNSLLTELNLPLYVVLDPNFQLQATDRLFSDVRFFYLLILIGLNKKVNSLSYIQKVRRMVFLRAKLTPVRNFAVGLWFSIYYFAYTLLRSHFYDELDELTYITNTTKE